MDQENNSKFNLMSLTYFFKLMTNRGSLKSQNNEVEISQQCNQFLCDLSTDSNLYDINYHLIQNRESKLQITKIQKLLNIVQNTLIVFNPDSTFKSILNILGMFFIFIQIMTIPLFLAFEIESPEFTQFNDAVTVFFFFDILTNFNTSYPDKTGELIFDRKLIFQNYIKTWLAVDVISNFPIDWILAAGDSNETKIDSSYFKILRVTRVLRLLRALKLKQIIENIMDQIQIPLEVVCFISLLKLIFIILCFAHWIACFFCLLFFSESEKSAWLYDYEEQVGFPINDWYSQYIIGYYWSVVTMITVGYGDIIPKTTQTKIFTIFIMIFSSGMFGFIMNKIAIIFQEMDNRKEQISSLKSLINYLKRKNLSTDLQQKVRTFVEQYQEKQDEVSQISEDEFISFLSETLRDQYIKLVVFQVVKNCILTSNSNFSDNIIEQISQKLESKQYNFKEMIIDEQDDSLEKYLYMQIDNRIVIKIMKTKTYLQILDNKKLAGIQEFFCNKKYYYSIEAASVCQVYRIERSVFLEIFDQKRNIKAKQSLKEIQIKMMLNINIFDDECMLCNTQNHQFLNCNKLFQNSNRFEIIQKYENQLVTRNNFLRKDIKNSSLQNYVKLNKIVESNSYTNNNFINAENLKYKNFTQLVQSQTNRLKSQNQFKSTNSIDEQVQVIKNYQQFYPFFNLRNIIKKFNLKQKQIQQKTKNIKQQFKNCVQKAYVSVFKQKMRVLQNQQMLGLNISLIKELVREQKRINDLEILLENLSKIYGKNKITNLIQNYQTIQKGLI